MCFVLEITIFCWILYMAQDKIFITIKTSHILVKSLHIIVAFLFLSRGEITETFGIIRCINE